MAQTAELIGRLPEEKHIPYMNVVCVQNHKQVFHHFSGEGINGKELLNMFSCSKPVTVTAALRLVEQGAFKLDDPISRLFPSAADAVYAVQKGLVRQAGYDPAASVYHDRRLVSEIPNLFRFRSVFANHKVCECTGSDLP